MQNPQWRINSTNLCFNDEFPQIFDCRVTLVPVNILITVFEVDKFTLIPRYPREDCEQEKRCYWPDAHSWALVRILLLTLKNWISEMLLQRSHHKYNAAWKEFCSTKLISFTLFALPRFWIFKFLPVMSFKSLHCYCVNFLKPPSRIRGRFFKPIYVTSRIHFLLRYNFTNYKTNIPKWSM